MTARLIKGDEVAEEVRAEISSELKDLYDGTGYVAGLAVIVVGENPTSLAYISNCVKQSEKLGINTWVHRLDAGISHEELLELIKELNDDFLVHGIMIQMPLPDHLDHRAIVETIDPEKDVEGVHPITMGKLFSDEKGFIPCTAHSIMKMVEYTRQPVYGKSAVIIGRSNIVGKPLSLLLLRRNASITVCHTQTVGLPDICREADIVVAAAGSPYLVEGGWIKEDAMVIDVGVTQLEDKMVGDVNFQECSEVAGWISPVPGGVGPLTITMLMWNTLEAFRKKMDRI